jgi:hypothetical protein
VTDRLEGEVAGVAALNDPVRRALYGFVTESAEAVSREQAAAAVGVQKTLAAFHLDRLVDEGLLEFEFGRLTGRTGPGAGRPAKIYRRSNRQITLSLPLGSKSWSGACSPPRSPLRRVPGSRCARSWNEHRSASVGPSGR